MPSDYSQYKLCVCSHLMLVVWTEGRPLNFTGDRIGKAHGPGWYHVKPDGGLSNFGPPCEAGKFRFDFEWPASCTAIDNCLVEKVGENGRPEPTPSTKTLKEMYPQGNPCGEILRGQ